MGVGGGLAWFVSRSMEWAEVWGAITGLNAWVLVLAFGALLFAGLMEAFRWKLLLPGEQVSTGRLFFVVHAGKGVNGVSPVKVLSEVVQGTMLRYRHGIKLDTVVSSLVVVKALDILVTVSLVGGGLLLLPELGGLKPVVLGVTATLLALVIGFAVLGRRNQRIHSALSLVRLEKVIPAIVAHRGRRKVLLSCVVITTLAWLAVGTAAWLVAGAAGISLPFWLVSIIIVSVIWFAGVTPAPPGSMGVFEFGAVSTLGLFAVEPTPALTFAIVIHGLFVVTPLLVGVPALVLEWRRRRTMRKAAVEG